MANYELRKTSSRTDEENILYSIWREIEKLGDNVVTLSSSAGGWTDDGTNVRLTTATDTVTIASSLTVGGNATASGRITFLEDSDNGVHGITLAANESLAGSGTVRLPRNGGNLSTTPALDTGVVFVTEIIPGIFDLATDSDFTYNTGSDTLTINRLVANASITIGSTSLSINSTILGGSLSLSSRTINAVAGDSVTINSTTGRFRKDTSGTGFTLNNNLITSESIILLTPANAAIDASATSWTVVGDDMGFATITFNAAPTTDFDMNFLVIN